MECVNNDHSIHKYIRTRTHTYEDDTIRSMITTKTLAKQKHIHVLFYLLLSPVLMYCRSLLYVSEWPGRCAWMDQIHFVRRRMFVRSVCTQTHWWWRIHIRCECMWCCSDDFSSVPLKRPLPIECDDSCTCTCTTVHDADMLHECHRRNCVPHTVAVIAWVFPRRQQRNETRNSQLFFMIQYKHLFTYQQKSSIWEKQKSEKCIIIYHWYCYIGLIEIISVRSTEEIPEIKLKLKMWNNGDWLPIN